MGVFDNLRVVEASEHSVEVLAKALKRAQVLRKLAETAYDASEGKETALKAVKSLTEELSKLDTEQATADWEFVTDDIEELLKSTVETTGLRWRLNSLNKHLGSLRKGDFGFVFARPECLHPDTPVMLYSGKIIPAKEVLTGMALMGDDSTPRYVTGTTWGQQQMYKITYPWGESYTVNENHILSLKRSKIEGQHKYGDILNVSVKEYLSWPEGRKHRYKGWKTALNFTDHYTKIDPYFLGVWLGDGTSCNQQITNADSEVIDWLRGYCKFLGLSWYKAERKSQGKAYTISFTNKKGKPNLLREHLRFYGLLNNKHIPDDFKYNSRWVRQQVLAGLIDTDGYYDVAHNGYEIVSCSKTLAEDIVYLARSLGLHAIINERETYHRIGIYGDLSDVPIQISRKQQKKKPTTKRKGLQFGFIVESVGMGDYYGFTLTGNHLFVLGDFTVTHNTGKTTFLASEISHMAEQLKQMNSGPVLHINNEEQNDKVKLRYSQATLGATLEQLLSNKTKANESIKERIGGYILIPNQGTYTRRDVEQLCERTNPGLLIFDQIDKIGGFDGERDDLRLGSIYQWARDLAKQHCPTIGICQADGSGENTKWLTMGNVANAKTSKQAEADWILGIGKIHDGGYENVRFFHLSKNKLIGDADTRGERHGKWETVIDPSIARYRDIK